FIFTSRIRFFSLFFFNSPSTTAISTLSLHDALPISSWSQIVAERLGYELDEIEVLHGDTSVVPLGMDTYGSRSLAVGGIALYHATDRILDKARTIAGHQLEVAEEDLDYEGGRFSVKGSADRGMTVKEAALAAWTAHNLP